MRIRRRWEFLRLQHQGARWRTPLLTLLWLPAATPGTPRLGVTVSRKVGCAPVRNRVKRRLRALFRALADRWPAGLDTVVIARPEAARASYHELARDLDQWLERRPFDRPARPGGRP
jgi:ribonuclease P protein component